jgi:hypothetical protein
MKQAIYSKPQPHHLKAFFQQQGIILNDVATIVGKSVSYCHQRLSGYRRFTDSEELQLQQLAESLNQEVSDDEQGLPQ